MDESHEGSNRVIRGGSWNSNAENVRAANRNWNEPDDRNDNLGFRLARAHERAVVPAPDPTLVQPVGGNAGGKQQAGASVPVARRMPRRALAGRPPFVLCSGRS